MSSAPRDLLTLQGADIYKIKVAISACGPKIRQVRVTTAALDTAAGAVLVDPAVLPPGVEVRKVSDVPKIIDASGRRLSIVGIAALEVSISGLVAKIEVWVVPKLPVALLLGTPFLDLFTYAILPREKCVWVRDPETTEKWLVPLISKANNEIARTQTTFMVKVAAEVCISPFAEQVVWVRSERSGLSLVTPVQRRRSPIFVPNGLIDLPEDGSVAMLVANFSEEPLMIQRGRVVGKAE